MRGDGFLELSSKIEGGTDRRAVFTRCDSKDKQAEGFREDIEA
jgi:hypothetical protein